MPPNDKQNMLIIGLDAVALAKSANKAGHKIFAVDHYGDQDLRLASEQVLSIIQQDPGKTIGRLADTFNPGRLLKLAEKLVKTHSIESILLASGLEDDQQTLAQLNDLAPIIGNSPEVIQKIRETHKFFQALRKIGIPHPETVKVNSIQEARKAAKDIGYPVVIKPDSTLGGVGIRKAENRGQLDSFLHQICKEPRKKLLIQEFIPGTHASISFLATASTVRILAVNEQLIGNEMLGQREPFGYCGNITPLSEQANHAFQKKCGAITERIASCFNLTGSNGIDIVVTQTDTPYIIEVNPRFQGTLECTEHVLGLNLVRAHMNACLQEKLPLLIENRPRINCVRLILYARQRSIAPDLSVLKEARDIPRPEIIVEKGEPLCSIIAKGKTKFSTLGKAETLANKAYSLVKPPA